MPRRDVSFNISLKRCRTWIEYYFRAFFGRYSDKWAKWELYSKEEPRQAMFKYLNASKHVCSIGYQFYSGFLGPKIYTMSTCDTNVPFALNDFRASQAKRDILEKVGMPKIFQAQVTKMCSMPYYYERNFKCWLANKKCRAGYSRLLLAIECQTNKLFSRNSICELKP